MSQDSQTLNNRIRAEEAARVAVAGILLNPKYISITAEQKPPPFEDDGQPIGIYPKNNGGLQTVVWENNEWVDQGETYASLQWATNELGQINTTLSTVDGKVQTFESLDIGNRLDMIEDGQTGGLIGYPTKSDMDADTTQPEQTIGLVTNDTTASNNGYYRWDGSAWVKRNDFYATVLDPSDTSDAVTGKAVRDYFSEQEIFAKSSIETFQGVPYDSGFLTIIHVPAFAVSDFDIIKFGLDNYDDFKFRYLGSDTINPTSVSPNTSYYTEDKELDDSAVLAKPFVWVQILRNDGGNLDPSSVKCYQYIENSKALVKLENKIESAQTNFNTKSEEYINIIPDNLFQNGIDYWESQPVYGRRETVLSLESFTNPYSSKSLKAIAQNSSANNSWFGIYHDITNVMNASDTIVFKGYIYPTTAGVYLERRFRDASNDTIQTLNNINLVANEWNEVEFEATIPANTVYANFIVRNIPQTDVAYLAAWDVHKKVSASVLPKITQSSTTSSGPGSIFVSKSGDDANNGTTNDPVLTISKAVNMVSGFNTALINIDEGDYKEQININDAGRIGRIELRAEPGKKVRVLASDSLTNWGLVSGRTNVYSTSYAGTINVNKRVIYEDGKPSLPIAQPDRHALQKSLTHRLPYTRITEIEFNTDLATTLNDLDSSPGQFYYDEANDLIYIHTSDSNNPSSNGFGYEVGQGVALQGGANNNFSHLHLSNVQFYFADSNVLRLTDFYSVSREMVVAMGSQDNGIEEAMTFVKSYHDEVADTRDGIAGTVTVGQRASVRELPIYEYNFSWCHDNADDGSSHHSKGNVKTISGLFEFNGKSGIAPSNSCQWLDIGSICRYNKSNTHPSFGEGVEVVNALLSGDDGIGCTFTGIGTITYGNRIGFATRISTTTKAILHECVSRENDDIEYWAEFGDIYANNCKSTTSGTSVHKQTNDGGGIFIQNDNALT